MYLKNTHTQLCSFKRSSWNSIPIYTLPVTEENLFTHSFSITKIFFFLSLPANLKSGKIKTKKGKNVPQTAAILQSMRHWAHNLHQFSVYTFNISWGSSPTSSAKFNFNLYLSTSFQRWFEQMQAIENNESKFLSTSLELFYGSYFNRQEIVRKWFCCFLKTSQF